MTESKKRVDWLDIAKGLAMLIVIAGHTTNSSIVFNYIYSFHLPFFFILSGYTIKKISNKDLPGSIVKDYKRLVQPVLICLLLLTIKRVITGISILDAATNVLYAFLWGSASNYVMILGNELSIPSIGILWFPISVFWGKQFYKIFDKVTKYRLLILLLISLLGMLLGSIIWMPHCLDLVPVILLFFEYGRFLREKVDIKSVKWKITCSMSLILWIIFVGPLDIHLHLNARLYPYLYLSLIIALMGTNVFIYISQLISKVKHHKVLTFIGKNSLLLLFIHGFDTYLINIWNINVSSIGTANNILSMLLRMIIDVTLLWLFVYVKTMITKLKLKTSDS